MGLKSIFSKRKTSIIEESRIDYFAPKSLKLSQIGPSSSSETDRGLSGIARPGYGSLQNGNKVGAGVLHEAPDISSRIRYRPPFCLLKDQVIYHREDLFY